MVLQRYQSKQPQYTYHGNGAVKSISYYIKGFEDYGVKDAIPFGLLHREDGPAHQAFTLKGMLIREEWWQNDRPHREDGPAIICYSARGIRSCKWLYKNKPFDNIVNKWLKQNKIDSWTRMTDAHWTLFKLQVISVVRNLHG